MSGETDRPPAAARRGPQPARRALRPDVRLPPLRARRAGWRSRSPTPSATATSPTWWPHRWSGRRRPRSRWPRAAGSRSPSTSGSSSRRTSSRARSSDPVRRRCASRSAWRHLWNPLRPSWGEPYVEIAERMMAAVHDARDAARGHEAVLVSHQLPIWIDPAPRRGPVLPPRPAQAAVHAVLADQPPLRRRPAARGSPTPSRPAT